MKGDAEINRLSKKVKFAKMSSLEDYNYIKGFNFNLFTACRVLFSLCILADVVWYFVSFEVRSSYFKHLGISIWFLYLIIAIYSYFGVRLLLNLGLETSCLGMVITYAIVGFVVHHPVGSGGIGEYPKYLNGEVNFKQILSYQALIGGLLVMLGVPDMMKKKKLMHGSKSFAMVLGRAMIAIHFLLQTLYFKFYQHDRLTKHLQILGKSPFLHIYVVGTLHVLGSYYAWLGKTGLQRKCAALALAAMTIALAAVEQAYAASGVTYKLSNEAKVHYIIVQSGIFIGCLLLYSIGDVEAQQYKFADD